MDDLVDGWIEAVAALEGLAIAPECLPGVTANLRLLLKHREIMARYDDPSAEPAELFRP